MSSELSCLKFVGESVPQMKEPISDQLLNLKQSHNDPPGTNNEVSTDESHFNLSTHGKLHVIYGGTKVLQSSFSSKSSNSSNSSGENLSSSAIYGGLASIKSPPDHGCICFVLRTGFNTSQVISFSFRVFHCSPRPNF